MLHHSINFSLGLQWLGGDGRGVKGSVIIPSIQLANMKHISYKVDIFLLVIQNYLNYCFKEQPYIASSSSPGGGSKLPMEYL